MPRQGRWRFNENRKRTHRIPIRSWWITTKTYTTRSLLGRVPKSLYDFLLRVFTSCLCAPTCQRPRSVPIINIFQKTIGIHIHASGFLFSTPCPFYLKCLSDRKKNLGSDIFSNTSGSHFWRTTIKNRKIRIQTLRVWIQLYVLLLLNIN